MKIIHYSFRRSFKLFKKSMPIASVKFLRWYGFTAEVRIPSGLVKFTPTNFWRSEFQIEQNSKEIGQLTFNWKQQASIDLKWPGEATLQAYRLRRRGIFRSHYELTDKADELIARLTSKINWRNLSSETKIEYLQPLSEDQQILLNLCCGYSITIIRSRRSSG